MRAGEPTLRPAYLDRIESPLRSHAPLAPLPPAAPAPLVEPEKCEHIDCNEMFATRTISCLDLCTHRTHVPGIAKLRRLHQRFHRICTEATRLKCTRCQKETDPDILKRGILPPNGTRFCPPVTHGSSKTSLVASISGAIH